MIVLNGTLENGFVKNREKNELVLPKILFIKRMIQLERIIILINLIMVLNRFIQVQSISKTIIPM